LGIGQKVPQVPALALELCDAAKEAGGLRGGIFGGLGDVQHQGLLAAGRGAGGRRLPLDELGRLGRRRGRSGPGSLGRRRVRSGPGGLGARSVWRRHEDGSWRRGSARSVTRFGTFRRGRFRRGSCLFKDGRSRRLRPPGSFFFSGADVAGAGVLVFWEKGKILLRAVI
jgi:hypothetical protein